MLGSRREIVIAGLMLGGILLVFFHEALLPGRVLGGAALIFRTPFFSHLRPDDAINLTNQIMNDQVLQFIPWRHFAWESIRQGHLPLWNPYSSTGTPFSATMQSAVFYPINLFLTLLPFEQTFVWSAIIRLWVAGLSTYLLARRYALGQAASLVSALSFMLSGFLVVWLGWPHANVAVWLPALILTADLLVQAQTSRQITQSLAALSVIVGIQFTGGHIETSLDILLALGLYYLLRWNQVILPQPIPMVSKMMRLALPLVALTQGVALGAIQLLPFLEWLPLSAEYAHRLSGEFRVVNPTFWLNVLTLPLVVFPDIFNNPSSPYPYWSFLPRGNYNENVLYVGILPLLLALLAVRLQFKQETLVRIWLIVGLLALGLAFQMPVVDWINQLPGLNLNSPGRFRLVASFSLCILAGFGAQLLWEVRSHQRLIIRRLWIKWCTGLVALCALFAFVAGIVLRLVEGRVREFARQLVDLVYARRAVDSDSLNYYYGRANERLDSIVMLFRIDNPSVYLPVILSVGGLIVVVVTIRYPHLKLWTLKAMLLFLVVADLVSFGWNYNPAVPAKDFYPETAIVSQLTSQRALFRFTAIDRDLLPDVHMMWGLSDIRGMDFPTLWYDKYLQLTNERIPWVRYGIRLTSVNSPLLRVLNVKYIVASNDIDQKVGPQSPNGGQLVSGSEVRNVLTEGKMNLLQLADSQPRSFMVYDAINAQSDDEASQLLKKDPDAVFRRVVLSDAEEAAKVNRANASQASLGFGDVSVISYGPSETVWKVVTDDDGYLVNTDAYYPGWRAYVDEMPARVIRANIAFRSVYVPKGEHVVVFRYEPFSVLLGAVVSLISLLTIVAVPVLGNRTSKRANTVPHG